MDEIEKLMQKGEVSEIFASGTAVIVSPVRNVEYKNKNHSL